MSDRADDPVTWITIPLDRATADRLSSLSDVCHAEPTNVAASLLHDILKDDEDTHLLLTAPAAGQSYN